MLERRRRGESNIASKFVTEYLPDAEHWPSERQEKFRMMLDQYDHELSKLLTYSKSRRHKDRVVRRALHKLQLYRVVSLGVRLMQTNSTMPK